MQKKATTCGLKKLPTPVFHNFSFLVFLCFCVFFNSWNKFSGSFAYCDLITEANSKYLMNIK